MAKKLFLILSLVALFYIEQAKACTPLDVPNFVSQTISGNNLLLNWESVNVWTCNGYTIEVEIKCANSIFTGAGPFYQSPALNKTSPYIQAYPQQTIDISGFCPGGVYNFRAREVWIGGVVGNWSSSYTFTVPGNPVQPSLTLSASQTTICSGQSSQLSSTINGCGQAANYTYSWFPSNGLSCTNCPNPVANPTLLTTYTCSSEGDQTVCWSATSTITVFLNTISSPGTVVATPSVCSGSSATVGLTGGGLQNQWELSNDAGATWLATGFSNTLTFATGTLAANQCFRTIVSGCVNTYTSAMQCITVYPLPQLTVTSSDSLICPGETVTLSASGALDYLWTTASFITGSQVIASPLITTDYYVNGTDTNGCSNTTNYVQLVDACLGLHDFYNPGLELIIAPNPNQGNFLISSKSPGHFVVVNQLGQLLQLLILDASNYNSASVKGLAPGVYYIHPVAGYGPCKKIVVSN